MFKLDGSSMKKVSPQFDRYRLSLLCFEFAWRAIKCIASHRMANRRKMHANLVLPAGFDPHLKQSEASIGTVDLPERFPVSDGLASLAAASGHSCATNHIPADGRIDFALRLRHPAMHQGDVSFLSFAA